MYIRETNHSLGPSEGGGRACCHVVFQVRSSGLRPGGVSKAMASRIKYRTKIDAGQIKRRSPSPMLSVHPENRGGVYPQGDDVKQLAIRLAKGGFSQEEVDHQGSVCKSHLPPQLR